MRFPSALTQARDGFGTGDTLPPLVGTHAPGGLQYSLLPGLGPDYDEYSPETSTMASSLSPTSVSNWLGDTYGASVW